MNALSLDFRTDFFDLWVYRRTDAGDEFLLLRTSQEKADRFFGGGRFWQIPTDAVGEREDVRDACRRLLRATGVVSMGVWSADHERHEALLNLAVVRDRRHRPVAAGRLKLGAA